MHNYKAPLKDMRFAMQELAELKDICEIPSFEAIDIETVDAVLEEGAKLPVKFFHL